MCKNIARADPGILNSAFATTKWNEGLLGRLEKLKNSIIMRNQNEVIKGFLLWKMWVYEDKLRNNWPGN